MTTRSLLPLASRTMMAWRMRPYGVTSPFDFFTAAREYALTDEQLAGITCPMLVNIGLEDDVCPPETGFALAKAMTNARVDLQVYPDCAHDAGSAFHARLVAEFLARHLRNDA